MWHFLVELVLHSQHGYEYHCKQDRRTVGDHRQTTGRLRWGRIRRFIVEWLNNISKKVNIRPSLLSIIFSLLSSLLCFHLFGPSLLACVRVCMDYSQQSVVLHLSHLLDTGLVDLPFVGGVREMVLSCSQFKCSMIYWSLFAFLYLFESMFTNVSAKSFLFFSSYG